MSTEHHAITIITKTLDQVKKLLAEDATVVLTRYGDQENFLVLFECDDGYRRIYSPQQARFSSRGFILNEIAHTIKKESAIVDGSIRAFYLQGPQGHTFWVGTNLATSTTRFVYRKLGEGWKSGY